MMKFPHAFHSDPAKAIRSRGAFTFVELMIALTIFSLSMIGVVYLHLFGLQQDKLVNSKLGASDESRRGYNNLMRDVRSCKAWEIGDVDASGTNFTPADLGEKQQGNALCLNYTTNMGNITGKIIYYFNTNANELLRVRPSDMFTTKVTDGLTNVYKSMIFEAQNFDGTPQTNRSHKGVICIWMEFKQFQYPLTKVGSGSLYDYYRMHFKVTSHVPDGI